MQEKTLKDYVDKNKIVTVYGVAENGTAIRARNVVICKVHGCYRDYFRVYYYGKNNKVITVDSLALTSLNLNDNFYKLDGFTYFLNPNDACKITISNIRVKKRELDKKQMDVQRLMNQYNKRADI